MGNKITRRCTAIVDERYTRPQGLYPQRDVDQKKLRRLILDAKLAPCFPGEDEPNADFEECPICFLCYPSLNRSKCCSKGVCTECYLQMKSPRAARATQCPFCKSHNYAVEFRGVKTLEEKTSEAADEQKFIEAKIRMRKQELLDDKEREQRQKETHRHEENSPENTLPRTDDELAVTSPLVVELPESCSELIEIPQQESVISDSSCDDLDSSRVQEESGSEGSLAPTAAVPQQPVLAMEPATSQHQPRAAPSGYARHRDDEFDFDLEDIMVMEAIWQSIQEQGICLSYTASQPVIQMAQSTQPSGSEVPESGVNADPTSISEANRDHQQQQLQQHFQRGSGSMTGGLATAIAALAERHAIKGESLMESLQTRNNRASSAGQAEVGSSSSYAPVVGRLLTRPATDGTGEVMLPQTFEEQMMLAMALSISDAQSRARLEDSHPRPLPNVS